ncbi:putative Ig domain-containing protein [Aliikangiella sp. IMCC44359]|uniref:putative Ig domain-containing protein n=1 Tax=Aliikangiella sp. IMCC44359 TaxID=3459125 RepID=UPI00403A876B
MNFVSRIVASVILLASVFSVSANSSNTCQVYPLTIPSSLIKTSQLNSFHRQIDIGVGEKSFSWLMGDKLHTEQPYKIALFANQGATNSLHFNKNSSSSGLLWAQGVTSVPPNEGIHYQLHRLIGQVIQVPVWSDVKSSKNGYHFAIERYADIELIDFDAAGQRSISFIYHGISHCKSPKLILDGPKFNHLSNSKNSTSKNNSKSKAFNESSLTSANHSADSAENQVRVNESLHEQHLKAKNYLAVLSKKHPVRYSKTMGGVIPAYAYGIDSLNSSFDWAISNDVANGIVTSNGELNWIPSAYNTPPETYASSHDVTQNTAVEIQVNSYDADGDYLTHHICEQPQHGVLAGWGPYYTYTPDENFVGIDTFEFSVSASNQFSNRSVVTLNVISADNPNQAPSITSSPVLTVDEKQQYTYQVNATDPDVNDTLTYSATILPEGMTISVSGLINWIPTSLQIGSHSVNVVVTDAGGLTDSQSFNLVVNDINEAPAITSTPIEVANENSVYIYQVEASDPDVNDTLTYSATSLPDGMTVDPSTGLINWTPSTAQIGSHPIVIVVTDSMGLSDTQNFDLVVSNVNDAPFITSTPLTEIDEKQSYIYDVNATDPDVSDNLTYALTTKPAGMSISTDTGVINWIPTNNQIGTHSVVVVVTDNGGLTDTQSFNITVNDVNEAPVITSTPLTLVNEESVYLYQVNATDPDPNDTLSFYLSTQPAGMTIDTTSGLIRWTPSSGQVGIHSVALYVSDIKGLLDTQEFVITVANVNQAPVITSTPVLVAQELADYAYQVTATDPDNDAITFTLNNAPVGMALSTNGLISWTPQVGQSGNHSVTVSATDSNEESDVQTFTIAVEVQANNSPSIISSPKTSTQPASVYRYLIDATDADDDVLSYTLVDGPTGIVVSAVSGALTWTPQDSDRGAHLITVSVNDGKGGEDFQTYTLTVGSQNNQSPVITSTPIKTTQTNQAYTYSVMASDADNDVLGYQLTQAPAGMNISTISGVVSWMPDTVGSYLVEVEVSDGRGGFAKQRFNLVVNSGSNQAPEIISESVNSATVNALYAYQVEAVDPENETLTYSLINSPTGFYLDSNSGLISWVPGVTGDYAVKVRVKDLQGAFDEQAFSIQVSESPENNAPQIISQPVTQVINDQVYQYQVGATDIDGDVLTYSLEHSVYGLLINPATGLINWLAERKVDDYNYDVTNQCVSDIQGAFSQALPNEKWTASDLIVTETLLVNNQINIKVLNRGVARSAASNIQIFAQKPDAQILPLTTLNVDEIDAGQVITLLYDFNPGDFVNHEVYMVLDETSANAECFENNNLHHALIVDVNVMDTQSASDSQTYLLNVVSSHAPEVVNEPVEVLLGNQLVHQIVATDKDLGDTQSYQLLTGPAGVAVSTSGELIWTPTVSDVGEKIIQVRVTDLSSNHTDVDLIVNVVDENRAPKIISTPIDVATQDTLYQYDVDATDENQNDVLTYKLVKPMDGMTINSETGVIDWTPTEAEANYGVYTGKMCRKLAVPDEKFEPILMWEAKIPSDVTVPVVGPLVDTNGNGISDPDDIPTVVVLTKISGGGQIYALNGKTGQTYWVYGTKGFRGAAPAIADIDNDKRVDVLTVHGYSVHDPDTNTYEYFLQLIAINNDGTLKWESEPVKVNGLGKHYRIQIADLDADGSPELFLDNLIFDNQGKYLRLNEGGGYPLIADIDLDGYQEVISGQKISNHDGSIRMDLADQYHDAYRGMASMNGVMNMDDDPYPEFFAVGGNVATHVFDHDGILSRYFNHEYPTWKGGAPFIGNVDGKKGLEVGYGAGNAYVLRDEKQNKLWSHFGRFGDGSGFAGSSGFDFYGMGKDNVIHIDHEYLHHYDGIYAYDQRVQHGTYTQAEYPIIVDVNGDGHANIVAYRSGGYVAYQDKFNRWPATRKIWNNHSYVAEMINDDGSVPRRPITDWTNIKTRVNPVTEDLRQVDLQIQSYSIKEDKLSFNLLNSGTRKFVGDISVSIYQSNILVQTKTITNLSKDASKEVLFDFYAIDKTKTIRVVVDTNGTDECDTDNNEVILHAIGVSVEDQNSATDSQYYYVSVLPKTTEPDFSIELPTNINQNDFLEAQVNLLTVDKGDEVHYRIENPPEGMRISLLAGTLNWETTQLAVGDYSFSVITEDRQGNEVKKDFTITVDESWNNTYVEVVGDPPTVIKAGDLFQYDFLLSAYRDEPRTFGLRYSPDGMTVHNERGRARVEWTPTIEQLGRHDYMLWAEDAQGARTSSTFAVLVVSDYENAKPFIYSIPEKYTTASETYTYQVKATDPENHVLTLSLIDAPTGMTFDTATNIVSWTPTINDVGQHTTTLRVEDEHGAFAEQTYTLSVMQAGNSIPVFTSTPVTNVAIGESYRYLVEVDDADGDSVVLTLKNAPTNVSFADNTITWTPLQSELGVYPIEIEANDGRGGYVVQTFNINVNPAGNKPPEITSTPNQLVTAGNEFEYIIVANDPDSDLISYQLENAPAGMNIDVNGSVKWQTNNNNVGTHSITVKVTDSFGLHASQTFDLVVMAIQINQPPQITSIPVYEVLQNQTYQYPVSAQDADGDELTYQLVQAPAAMIIDAQSGLIQWPTTSTDLGSHSVHVKVSDTNAASVSQVFSVVVVDNHLPIFTSTPVITTQVDAVYNYTAQATDADNHVITYSLVQAPTNMSIDSLSGQVSWTAGVDDAGIHNVQVKATDSEGGEAIQTYSLAVRYAAENNIPQILSLPQTNDSLQTSYSYQVVAQDIDGDVLTYQLTQAPTGMTVDASGLVNWPITETQVGEFPIRIEVSDGQSFASQSYTLTVYEELLPLEGGILLTPEFAQVNETIEVQVLPYGGTGYYQATAKINNVVVELGDDFKTQWTSAQKGLFPVEVELTDGESTITIEKYISVGDADDTDAPVIQIHSPTLDQVITKPVPISVTVQDDNLAYYRIGVAEHDSNPQSWDDVHLILESTTAVTEAEVATLDPTLLMNGLHDVYLEAIDLNGQINKVITTVSIEGEMKLGHFSITFEEVNIPVAGVPVRVTRTYDTRRRKQNLDFGKGWSVDYQNVLVQENQVPGWGWSINEYNNATFGEWCIEPNGSPIVTVRLPDGDIEKFRVKAKQECQILIATEYLELGFEPIEGTTSTLEQLDYGLLRVVNGNVVDPGEEGPVNPTNYKLTTKEGMEYLLHQKNGVLQVKEPNTNYLDYSVSGVIHNTGIGVTFERDAEGRIRFMILPDDSKFEYQYSSSGDLKAVIDPEGNTTRYTYIQDHYLEDIIDPRGKRVTRNEYNDEGRLVATIDANNNRIEFTHDVEGKVETIQDRNGHPQTYVYDDNGWILSETNALNETTTHTYNEYGVELSRTNHLNETQSWTYDDKANMTSETDATGYTVFYEYNDLNLPTKITDSESKVLAENTYDIGRNLSAIKRTDESWVYMQHDVGLVSTGTGLLKKTIDAEGNETEYPFDWFKGITTGQIDANGVRTDYEFDARFNKTAEVTKRTLADGTEEVLRTEYEYDKNNRLTKTIYPDGSTHKSEYDASGLLVATIDAFERRTEMEYNDRGELVKTTYPDLTTEIYTYDKNGNKLTETDRNNNTTSYEYDALNRVIKTTYADNSFTQNEYDAAGRVKANIDANGNRTEYEYDKAGRRTKVIDALLNEHTFIYDNEGNLTSETDALNHKTTYTYDVLSRKVATVYHDDSSIQTELDGADRKTGAIDQAEVKTTYAYDNVGRLLKVTDALLNETSFTYDEQGNKLTQTDAEGRVTRWTYDNMGRVLTRTLPLGQVESFTYDIAGNVKTRTDFNGDVMTYVYDNNNRVSSVIYSKDNSVDSFTYDNVGNRLTATKGEETWTYTYDKLNRLSSETKPDGKKLEYGYDAQGNKTQLKVTYAVGDIRIETFTYDELNRLKTVTDSEANKTTYEYDAVGNRTSVIHSNANITSYVYDELNRLTQIQEKQSDDTLIGQFDYTLHATGRRTKITELNGRVSDYTYDDIYRLTNEDIIDSINGNYTAAYTFDKVGNRTQSIINGVTTAYTYDNNDRLTQEGGEHYTYDDNGNTLTKTIDSDITTYTYDARQKLISAEITESGVTKTSSYQYDIDGIRTQKVEESVTTNYLTDSNRDYAQVIAEMDSNDSVTASYTYGDDLLSMMKSGEIWNYHYDGLGSTRSLTNSSGNESDTYAYDAFGNLVSETGSTENAYLFTGEQFDESLGQYYLRARYYNQGIGRFTQQDTWMGNNHDPVTLHKYLYANADPVSYTDPTGNFSIGEQMAAAQVTGVLTTIAIGNIALDHLFKRSFSRQLQKQAVAIPSGKSRLLTAIARRAYEKKEDDFGIPILSHGFELVEHSTHISDSQMGFGSNNSPTSVLLNYAPRTPGAWYNKYYPCKNRIKGITQTCDEYPFGSTVEGGETAFLRGGVSLRLVSFAEQRIQARLIKKFYNTAKVNAADPTFISVALPGLPSFFTDRDGKVHSL